MARVLRVTTVLKPISRAKRKLSASLRQSAISGQIQTIRSLAFGMAGIPPRRGFLKASTAAITTSLLSGTLRALPHVQSTHMPRVKLVIFDIGGTIVEDNGEVLSSFTKALANNSLHASSAELTELKGASKREVIARFVERQYGKDEPGNEARIAKAYEEFKTFLEHSFANGGVKPIPGAATTFAWLKAHGILCATTTGFYRAVTERILARAG
jgi:Haloacid dehalogenase-like hydrolase